MTPDDIGAMRDAALDLTQPLIDDLIEDICRRVAKAGKITDTAEYEIYRAKALGASKKAIEQAISRQKSLNANAVQELTQYISKADYSGERDSSIKQLVDAYLGITRNEMDALLTDLQGIGPDGQAHTLNGVYRQCMDKAFREVFSGTTDYTTALRRATKNLTHRGIRAVVQANDRTVSLEYATRRTLMTQMGRLDQAIQDKNHDAIGCDGWEISAHAACAPDHEPIQGRQYTDDDYKLLNETLQRPIGMFNCKHFAFPIVLGINSPQYTAAELQKFSDDNAAGLTYEGRHYTLYEATQTQSSLENAIRYKKSDILADRTLEDDAKLRADQIRLARIREEYNRFSRAAGLPTRSERLQVTDFGHSEAAKAVSAAKSQDLYTASDHIPISAQNADATLSFQELPKQYLDAYHAKMEKSVPAAKKLLQRIAPEMHYTLTDGLSHTKGSTVFLQLSSDASVLAHELFHTVDFGVSTKRGFAALLKSDYAKTLSTCNGDVFRYLRKNYPTELEYTLTGDLVLKSKYASISDIINGVTSGDVMLGSGHLSPGYWDRSKTLEKEAWADFGRMCYTNDESLLLLKEMFPTFYREAMKLLEEMCNVSAE